MSLRVDFIDPASDPRWDLFVESHHLGLICHLSGWKRVLERSFPQMKGYYVALLDGTGGPIVAGLPVFQVRSWLTGNRLVSIPFATVCDPLASTDGEMEELLYSALKLYRKGRNSYMELRTLNASERLDRRGFSKSSFFKHHFIQLEPGAEEIQRNFHKGAVRVRIRKAINSGLKLKIGDSEQDLLDFFNLHKLTRKRLGLPCHPYRFLLNLWREFTPKGLLRLYLAIKNNAAVAGLIVFQYRGRVSLEFGAADHSFLHMSPTHFLYWNAIARACEEGYKILDFGRTSSLNEGLITFKRRWGTQEVDLPSFYYPLNTEKRAHNENSSGYKLMGLLCRKAPDFALPALGRFCYRHLG